MNARLLITLLVLGIALPALAVGEGGSFVSPAEVVRSALERHPMIEASEQEVAAADADRALAKTGYLPRLDFVETIARSTNPVFVFGSKLGQERFTAADFDLGALNTPDALNNFSTKLELRQNVWDGHRTILGRKNAELGVDAAQASHRRTADRIVFDALSAYRDLGVALEMAEVTRDAEEAAVANLDLARELEQAGLAVPSDRMSAEVRQAEIRAMHIRAEQGITVARAALARAMGIGGPGSHRVRFSELRPDGPDEIADRWIERAWANRQDLAALRLRVEQAFVGERLARSRRRPEIGAMAGYEWNGDRLLGTDGDNWTVGLGLSVPIFDGNETRSHVARARADRSRLEALVRAMEQGIALEVRAAWSETDSAARRLEIAEAALKRADEALRIVRDRYAEGLAVMVELLAAEAAHTRVRAQHVTARGDLFLARANLRLAGGSLDPADPNGLDTLSTPDAGRQAE